jgi:hypothetical protein
LSYDYTNIIVSRLVPHTNIKEGAGRKRRAQAGGGQGEKREEEDDDDGRIRYGHEAVPLEFLVLLTNQRIFPLFIKSVLRRLQQKAVQLLQRDVIKR